MKQITMISKKLYLYVLWFVCLVFGIWSKIAWAHNKESLDITDRININTEPAQNWFGLDAIKHLLFDEAILFTLFSALALLIALLGAAIIIGRRK